MARDLEQMRQDIEEARRARKWRLVNKLARRFVRSLPSDSRVEQLKYIAAVDYERHMVAWERAKKTLLFRHFWLKRSRQIAEVSAQEALAAGDRPGFLFPYINIAGHLLPAFGEWQLGLAMLRVLINEAENLSTELVGPDAYRAYRNAMNGYFLIIRLLAPRRMNKEEVQMLVAKIDVNPVYRGEYENADWAVRDLKAANEFIKQ